MAFCGFAGLFYYDAGAFPGLIIIPVLFLPAQYIVIIFAGAGACGENRTEEE
jgi:hypothetical protein